MPRLAGLVLSLAAFMAACEPSSPPPASPVVAPDSEEGREARAQDEAEQQLRKQREAKALARKNKKNLRPPDDE